MKSIWLTSLGSTQKPVNDLISKLKTYGLTVQGHFWKDDLKNMAWMAPVDHLAAPEIPCWAILSSDDQLHNPDIRYGLSLAALSIQARRGIGFPVVILQTGTNRIDSSQLPAPLKGADIFSASDPGIGAKLVAKAHAPAKAISSDYHIIIHGNAQIGQWFEIRPETVSWPGIMFGVSDAQIAFQAAGPAGRLPDKSILKYPMQGLKIQLGETEYTAWATQNELNNTTSYFVKVDGFPSSVIFGPYSEEAAADVYVLDLK